MMWFFALLIVLLIGAVMVVSTGAGDSMVEEYDDRPDVRVQADGPLRADDLRRVRFTTAVRGYRSSEVDALLARLARELDGRAGAAPEGEGTPRPVPSPVAAFGDTPAALPVVRSVRQSRNRSDSRPGSGLSGPRIAASPWPGKRRRRRGGPWWRR